MLKITEVNKTRSIMLDDADIYEIMKPTTSAHVTVTTNGGAQRYTIQESIATLQTQYPPNQLVKVTQVSDNTVFLLYAHRVKTWVENVNGTTQVNFYTGRSHLTVIEDFATIQANYSIASDNFISSIVYQNANGSPTPTSPNYPNLLSTYNNGGTRLTDLTALLAALGAPFTLANTLFVSTNGNNGTAIVGRLDKTWADPWAAIAAATTGQSVVIFPGPYSSASGFLIKTGVKSFAYPGVTITYTSTLAGSDSPFATNNSTRANGVFKGYADITFAKTAGNFQVGGYVDGILDIELRTLAVNNANIFFPESQQVVFKAIRTLQSGTGSNECVRIESTTTTGTVKRYDINIIDTQFTNCDYGLVVAGNVDADINLHINNLHYTNLTTDLVSTDNQDCGKTSIKIKVDNAVQFGSTQGGVVVDMQQFGNISGDNNCSQNISVKNVLATLSAMRIGNCYSGKTTVDLEGVLQMTDASIESAIANTGAGICEINTDLALNWNGATAPIAIHEFNGETSTPANTVISGAINVLGKTLGDASVFNTPNNSSDYVRLRNLEINTGADYIFGDVAVGAVATPIQSSYNAAPFVGVGLINPANSLTTISATPNLF